MNREHFRAFLWLRWRLRVNQFRKAGPINAVLFFVFLAFGLITSVGLFVAGFFVGLLVFPGATPLVRLLVWDGAVVALLSCWMMGLMTDLQRTEGLAIDKVLHLPVSPSGAFLINYLSSLASLTLIVFVPGMVGLILGQVIAGSAAVLLAFPLLAAFVFALTGATYQFQGWLASLMSNPRRRRTVVVVFTLGFVLMAQLPNLLIHTARPSAADPEAEDRNQLYQQQAKDAAELEAGTITPQEAFRRETSRQDARSERRAERERQEWAEVERVARIVSSVVPPGWLALGAADAATGSVGVALLGALGFGAIGSVCLWRAYRTTIRLYTGEFTSRSQPRAETRGAPTDPNRLRLLEWRLPWVSEQASAVAVTTFRSLMRAPEVKMVFVAPFVMLVVSVGGGLSAMPDISAVVRPLLALGAGTMITIVSGGQLVGNQFGFDRSGFRAYVLSPVPRREILLGKNLAPAPIGLGLGLFVMLGFGIAYPMRADHYPACAAQLVTAYLLFCTLANAMSILAPIPMAAGSMQASQVKVVPVLLGIAFMMLLPLVLLPAFLPLGVEILLQEFAGVRGVPVALVLSLLFLAGTVFLYRAILTRQGAWLSAREQSILEAVTSKE